MKEKWIKFLKFIGAIPVKQEEINIEERIKNSKDYKNRYGG